jgi:pimeloyl-ACP methyl ester carboxylesterase
LAQDFVRFFDKHNIPKAVLLGHSLGGKAAMVTSLLFPERIEKLIVADISPRNYGAKSVNMQMVKHILVSINSIDLNKLKDRNAVDQALTPLISDITLRRFVLHNLQLPDHNNPERPMTWKPNVRVLLEKYSMLTDFDCNELVKSTGPFAGQSLFVKGGRSDYITEQSLDDINAIFPASEVQTIAGAGHWVHIDNPDAFVKTVDTFLKK